MSTVNFFGDFKNTINGDLVSSTEFTNGINPASSEPMSQVPIATLEDVDKSVRAARAASKLWARVSHEKRVEAILAYADSLERNSKYLAELLTEEQGKPLASARDEIAGSIDYLRKTTRYKLEEETVGSSDSVSAVSRYTPLGVAVGIVPWNFPVLTAISKICPAVLTGNAIIVKPSPFTPYTALKLGEVAQQFFPRGVVQALAGDERLGPWLTGHAGVDKISFTGSSATGKKVMENASKSMKRVTLELGGNDPAIVRGDVNVTQVAEKIGTLAFANAGQICIAIKRIYVHSSIYEEFKEAIAKTVGNLRVGDGKQDGVTVGPVQNSMQFGKVKEFFSDIDRNNQKVVVGGDGKGLPDKGFFLKPTIVDRPPEDSRIVVEEPFGPILPLLTWDDENEVIERANNTRMGLGASVWSKDIKAAQRIADQLEAGSVWINTHTHIDPCAPFGGHKESGLGHENALGGLRAYCNIQTQFIAKEP